MKDEEYFRLKKPRASRVFNKIKRERPKSSFRKTTSKTSRFYHAKPISRGPAHREYARRVVVKVNYTKNGKSNDTWAKFGYYLEREGAQKEGEKGIGFNANSEEVSLSKTLYKWQNDGNPRLYKITISPEDGEKLDLRQFTKEYMSSVEETIGKSLDWAAIEHYNTAHPHVHVVIKGTNNLMISQEMIRNGMRNIASDIATEKLGYKSEHERILDKENEIKADRFTHIDKDIKKRVFKENQSFYISESYKNLSHKEMVDRRLRIHRLNYLEKIGVAEKVGAMTWKVDENFENSLKEMEILKTRTKMIANSRALMTDPRCVPVVTKLKENDMVMGRVLGKGVDEKTDRFYLLLEGVDSRAHIIYLNNTPDVKTRELVKVMGASFEKDGKKIVYPKTNGYGIEIPDKGFKNVEIPKKALDDYLDKKQNLVSESPSAGFAKIWHLKLLERKKERNKEISFGI